MQPESCDVLIYTKYLHIIGGIETFVDNFVELMSPLYDIAIMVPSIPPERAARLSRYVKVYTKNVEISCNTLLVLRVMEDIPFCITYKHSIRMCHACKARPEWFVKDDCDDVVHVSEASKESFDNESGTVIHNPLIKTKKKSLLLVSATRIPAPDKGKNADRMLQLASMLNQAGIPFLWFNFSDNDLKKAPMGFVNVGTFQELQPLIAKADYLVQLSDAEGFCYSMVEALANGTAVICTPFETTKELGVEDGKNGYIVPFDMKFDVKKLLDVPSFDYEYDNEEIKQSWIKLLGKTGKKRTTTPDVLVEMVCLEPYVDTIIGRKLRVGEHYLTTPERMVKIEEAGYGKRI